MAVEVDVELRKPLRLGDLEVEVGALLKRWLDLHSETKVEANIQESASDPSVLSNYPSICLRVSEIAEVSIMPYLDPFYSNVRACISYAPLRSAESKLLCFAAATAIANTGRVKIEDDGKIFGLGQSIDPAVDWGALVVQMLGPALNLKAAFTADALYHKTIQSENESGKSPV